ncbi:MAG TPA: DUF4153 domain-containing protein [Planctomicrobium sp.]|nr:DUF4153 domain-containing protein [Planctomicrobium sp.]
MTDTDAKTDSSNPVSPGSALENPEYSTSLDGVRNRPAPPKFPRGPDPGIWWLELPVLLLLVVLSDVTIYSSHGYFGLAAFFGLAPLLFVIGAPRRRFSWQTVVVVLMIFGVSLRLIWCGNGLAVTFGFLLLAATSLSLAGGVVTVTEVLRVIGSILQSSLYSVLVYESWGRKLIGKWIGIPAFTRVLQYVLPPVVGGIFLCIFVMANPDLSKWLAEELQSMVEQINQWITRLIDSPWRVFFWGSVLLFATGLMRPTAVLLTRAVSAPPAESVGKRPCELYPAFRNTLMMLIALFAAYLCFEFWTMWTREFPPGFYYAGYAHEGAAWLTVALGLATLLLSIIFRGGMLTDVRRPFLQRLGMIWSVENLILAAAVYNRLFIYIDFNGMTRMRVVALLGISAVVAGVILVVIKIRCGHRFAWVIRHQLVALSLAFYLYAVLPVDAFVNNYNVQQILAGNLKPSVQIAHHPTSVEGKLKLFPLLSCPDEIIRNGIAELLNATVSDLNSIPVPDWTARQIANERFLKQAKQHETELTAASGENGSWNLYQNYSFQWY